MSTKLKPCIFCGEKKRIGYTAEDSIDGVWGDVFCSNCHANGPEIGPEKTYKDFLKAATEAWNALPRHLFWTTETPTEEGWYWYKTENVVSILPANQIFLEMLKNSTSNCEWAGPIPKPKDRSQCYDDRQRTN